MHLRHTQDLQEEQLHEQTCLTDTDAACQDGLLLLIALEDYVYAVADPPSSYRCEAAATISVSDLAPAATLPPPLSFSLSNAPSVDGGRGWPHFKIYITNVKVMYMLQ